MTEPIPLQLYEVEVTTIVKRLYNVRSNSPEAAESTATLQAFQESEDNFNDGINETHDDSYHTTNAASKLITTPTVDPSVIL